MNKAQSPDIARHAEAVARELAWLDTVIEARLTHFFADPADSFAIPPAPEHTPKTALGALIERYDLDPNARLILALALAAHVNSALLDPFYVKNAAIDRAFSQFGGYFGPHGFQPTGETALFLVAGAQSDDRIKAMAYLDPDHPLRRQIGLRLEQSDGKTPVYCAILDLNIHRVIALCEGRSPRPDFAPSFPAKRLETQLTWDDLVLPDALMHQLGHITAWLNHRHEILDEWGLARQINRGFKVLFHGPPGTGKTLTASLLGKETGLDVYRVDLSMVVSKYIGETEKNLSLIFDLAAERDWILFFDEADALFGQRSTVSSSNDHYANQEVSYLLQRIEDCESLVILATNLRGNLDDAFFRRFQMSLGFSRPDAKQRAHLWRNIVQSVPLAEDVEISKLAAQHDLAGGAIANVIRHAAISARRRAADRLTHQDISDAITSEMRKEGRTP